MTVDPVAVVARLNELIAADPAFMSALFSGRHPANDTLADMEAFPVDGDRAGALSVINAICGAVRDVPPISAIYADGRLMRFELTERIKLSTV